MITVLVATYQGKEYLRDQLDSILNQTVKSLHVLISDDGSTDGTWDIIEEYINKYPEQVRGVKHKKESGDTLHPAAANFFWLLSQAEGDYVFLSDQDDVWREDKVETMLRAMEIAEARLGDETPILLYSDAKVVDHRLQEICPSFFDYQKIRTDRSSLNEILVENPVTGGAAMINKAVLPYVRQAPEHCLMHDWWLALIASCFGKIECIKKPLYQYRQHEHNTLGARESGSLENLKNRLRSGDQVRENYNQMFLQASGFLKQYSESLTPVQVEQLQAFLSLPYKGRMGKMKTICQYGFYKSSRLQTVAQCLTMPRR